MRGPRAAAGGVAGLLAVAVLAGGLAMASGGGYPRSRVGLDGGGAWLASPGQGLLTLIDGPAEQVVGSVRVRPGRDDRMAAVQSGTSALVVDRDRGTVARVDGATYQVSVPVRFGDPGPLAVYPSGAAAYVVDGSRRAVSVVDPATLAVRRELSPAAVPGADQSVVDSVGTLWMIDGAVGGLTGLSAGGGAVRVPVGDPSARLTLVGGRPVLLDLSRRRVARLGDDGRPGPWTCLEVRGTDTVQVLGATDSARVFAAVAETGTLVSSDLDDHDCGATVRIGSPGDRFGRPAQAGGYLLVPDQSSGHTEVVDAGGTRVVADLPVLGPGSELELVAKDGLVFYNDRSGDRAGVIRFDGARWTVGAAVRKYGTGTAGLLAPAGNGASAPGQPAGSQPPGAAGAQPGSGAPGRDPGRGQRAGAAPPAGPYHPPGAQNQPVSAGGPDPGAPGGPADPGRGGAGPGGIGPVGPTADPVSAPPSSTPSTTATSSTTTPPPVTVTVRVRGPGTVTADPAGAPPVTCPPACSSTVPAGTDLVLSGTPSGPGVHLTSWSVPGCAATTPTCEFAVAADRAVTVAFDSRTIPVQLTVGGNGSGSIELPAGGACAATCTTTIPVGTPTTFTAAADLGATFTGWSDCPAPAGTRCTLTPSATTAVRLTATFAALPPADPVISANGGSAGAGGSATVSGRLGDTVIVRAGGNGSGAPPTGVRLDVRWFGACVLKNQVMGGTSGADSRSSGGGDISYPVSRARLPGVGLCADNGGGILRSIEVQLTVTTSTAAGTSRPATLAVVLSG